MKDTLTLEEYNEMFKKDENGCYVNLIIPETGGFPEMNLIGKKPEEYTIDEITHSKTYRRVMKERIIDYNKEE